MMASGEPNVPINPETYATHYLLNKTRKIISIKRYESISRYSLGQYTLNIKGVAEEIKANILHRAKSKDYLWEKL